MVLWMANAVSGWFDRKIRWEAFRDLLHIYIFRYFVLWFAAVPILAYALKDLPPQISIHWIVCGDGATCDVTFNVGLPFNWQLLWLASLFFIGALALYQLRCPGFIKKYHSFDEYKKSGHDVRWITRESSDFLRGAADKARSKFAERLTTKNFAKAVPLPEDRSLYDPEVGAAPPRSTLKQTALCIISAPRCWI